MSAFGGKADVIHQAAECPLIAKSRHKDEWWKSENRPYGNHFFPTHRVLVCALTFQLLEPLNQAPEIDNEV